MFVSTWITWLWCLFSTNGLQRIPFCPTFCGACSFSLPFISFTSLPNIFLAFQTLPPTLCLVTIFTLFSFGPTGAAGHYLILHSGAPPTRGTQLDLTSLDQSVLSLLAQGLASSTLATYRSGIRQYTAFCQQFRLTPLPLSDLNLCRFVSYLHQQQLSPASVRLYLAALRYLQIVAVGHDPQPGEFPRLHYAVWTV